MSLSALPRSSPRLPLSLAERRLRGRALALLWMAGAALVVLALLLPDSSVLEEPQLAVVGGVAAGFAALMWLGAGRLPTWTFDAAVSAGTALVSVLIARAGGAASPFVLLLAWQLVFAGYFLPPRRAALQVVVAAAAFTAAVAAHSSDFPWTRWAVAVATFGVVGALVVALRRHVDELLGELELTARTDPLTGVLNRRGFDSALADEMRRGRRTGRPLGVVVCDIDHFKAVNDLHGHAAGDVVLRRVAAALRGAGREVDTVGRIGGEEFGVLLPETGLEEAIAVAERMRDALRASAPAGGLAVTASFGVATSAAGDVVAAADGALYAAKRAGRDCTRAAR